MAIYRNIQMSFWTDTKVADEFTPEDKYFYLYLFTNPHTNLAGCYEIGIRHIVNETGYSKETVERLLKRFSEEHKVAYYNNETKEILLVNWHKYNWTSSEKYRTPLKKQIENIKYAGFREFLETIFDSDYTVSIPYAYPIDTTSIDTTNTVNNTVYPVHTVKDKYVDMITNNIKEHNYSEYINNILTEWFMYKKEKGQSYKQIGMTRLLNKVDKVLLEHSEEELSAVIEECMERNYQGIIFEMLDKKKPGNTGSAYMDAINNRVNVVDDWV